MTDSSETGWVEVQRFARRSEAEQHALVLAAAGIDCWLVAQPGAVGLAVALADAARARQELAAYARENPPMRAAPPGPSGPRFSDGLDGAMAYGVVLIFLFSASHRQAFGQDWWSGAAQAGRIAGGAWWLALSSLGLHADLGHLVGNLAMGGLLGLLLAQSLGAGLAWFAILLAGAGGNTLNAFLQPEAHTAVGASTAVFGALGILSALAWRRQASLWGQERRRWLPLAAGVALLGFLGVGGERTDIGAHIAGFLAGCMIGAGLAEARHYLPQGLRAQWAFGAGALAIFAFAWLLALRAHA